MFTVRIKHLKRCKAFEKHFANGKYDINISFCYYGAVIIYRIRGLSGKWADRFTCSKIKLGLTDLEK